MRKIRTAALLLAMGAIPAGPASADVITDWNEKAVAYVTGKMTPPAAQRVVTMVHVAMFDAVNSIERRYRPYHVQLPAASTVSKEAAAAAAAGTVLARLHPQADAELRGAMNTYLAAIAEGDAKAEGVKLGTTIADRILEARANDGATAPDGYRYRTSPGVYVPTPATVTPNWPNVRPFGLTSAAQFRPQAPVALNSAEWAKDYNEIKDLGERNSTKRSAQQTENARFWLITGPQSTDPITRQVVVAKKMSVVDSARFMAVAAVALADAYIAVMDAKYTYEFWRPITAIRNGDNDDNPATERSATWEPIADTPMHPEYPCAHCIGSGALSSVLEGLLGGADIPEVAMTSTTAPGVTHRFTNLRIYADEVAAARIFAGFHYRFSTRVGQDMGRKIGEYVARTTMQPLGL